MRNTAIEMLEETLSVFRNGAYSVNGTSIPTKLTPEQAKECYVYLPEEVHRIMETEGYTPNPAPSPMKVGCSDTDTFSQALLLGQNMPATSPGKQGKVLVLNFANSVHPGGGVRRGSRAQEEDLCRKSSLLLSLESEAAAPYYKYNQSLNTYMGSDGIILTPNVEIVRDVAGQFLKESLVVSVLTCAAPMITLGTEGLSLREYKEMFYKRICGILKCAAYWGYEVLVLGAFGCGAFANDAATVSRLFYKALKNFDWNGYKAESFFRQVEFPVPSRSNPYNFNHFHSLFSQYYGDVSPFLTDRIRGSLFGGGAGDALGYYVEFMGEDAIFDTFGPSGITDYVLDSYSKKALISDDSQMTLFTANGMIVNIYESVTGTPPRKVEHSIADAYQRWYITQTEPFTNTYKYDVETCLLTIPELFKRRAPGGTCLSGLVTRSRSPMPEDFIAAPMNHSKGCGGVMRVAPLALVPWDSIEALDMAAAQASAITHNHPLGYMPSSILCHIIQRILFPKEPMTLDQIVEEALTTVEKLFAGDPYLADLRDIVIRAVTLSKNDRPDLENIHLLGEGWVGEEALAIAIYCSLKYSNDFSGAIIAAVNHKGDSDSTGAITGNIVGAIVGYEAIEDKWKEDLELSQVFLNMSDILYRNFAADGRSF